MSLKCSRIPTFYMSVLDQVPELLDEDICLILNAGVDITLVGEDNLVLASLSHLKNAVSASWLQPIFDCNSCSNCIVFILSFV